jgi:large subunit ribosomal protein L17
LRSLASALILTERDATGEENEPKVKGRIITTLPKAKEVRPLVEKCVTIACRVLPDQGNADALGTSAPRFSEKWKAWRTSSQWREWNAAIAPVVAARRRTLRLLGDKQAVSILFAELAPRFAERRGGYTRILRLAKPRLGDAGDRAILEFVGVHDRQRKKSTKPAIEPEVAPSAAEVAKAESSQPEASAVESGAAPS